MATKQQKKGTVTQPTLAVQCKRGGWVWCGILGTVLFATGVLMGYHTNHGREPDCLQHAPFHESTVRPVNARPDETTCKTIEEILLSTDVYDEKSIVPEEHVDKAEIYSKIAAKGCPESRETYKQMALNELKIARALSDDRLSDWAQIDVIEVYKKLDMKAEAQKFFEKMQRLTDPAIDFILQLERILSEEGK